MENPRKAPILELDKVQMPKLRGQEGWSSLREKEKWGKPPISEAASIPTTTNCQECLRGLGERILGELNVGEWSICGSDFWK